MSDPSVEWNGLHVTTSSNLQQHSIADFLEWHSKKLLVLNPEFQRRSVWSPQAKSYLIDTVLRHLSMPKIYIRTRIDLTTKQSIREVVDGQQRLRAITEFGENKLRLTKRAGDFAGMTYDDLGDEQKTNFLTYQLSVEQLINADDQDVLEVFARLNSYNVSLRPSERRHAAFQGPFKWAVREAAGAWGDLWDKYGIVTVGERLRMSDDSMMAEMFGILLKGVQDGRDPNIQKLYKEFDTEDFDGTNIRVRVDEVLATIEDRFGDAVLSGPLHNRPFFLMLFAAVSHRLHGIPAVGPDALLSTTGPLADDATDRLLVLSDAQEARAVETRELAPYVRATLGSLAGLPSRRTRFEYLYNAIAGQRPHYDAASPAADQN